MLLVGLLLGEAGSVHVTATGVEALAFDWDSTHFNGTGFGVDLGAAYDFLSGIRIAAAVENLVSRASWSASSTCS